MVVEISGVVLLLRGKFPMKYQQFIFVILAVIKVFHIYLKRRRNIRNFLKRWEKISIT